jgi:peptidoglycan LD-endopeptidase LytH
LDSVLNLTNLNLTTLNLKNKTAKITLPLLLLQFAFVSPLNADAISKGADTTSPDAKVQAEQKLQAEQKRHAERLIQRKKMEQEILALVPDAKVQSSIHVLRSRQLRLPIDGITPAVLQGSFNEARGDSRHEAVDIAAPRNTPVHALEDGTIARLFVSQLGGNTIYQTDPTGEYVYYYAHLEGYEPTIKEGDKVKRGQVIGFVGTSGNAPPNTPHLHLSISILTPEKKWWHARAIDPYEVYKSK